MLNQFFRYALVGAVGTTAHYLVLFLLIIFQVTPPLATAIGAGVGASINYVLCKTWVFSIDCQTGWSQVFRFLAAALIGMSLNVIVMVVLASTTGVWVAQLLATILTFLVVYHVNRYWTFPILPRCIA